MEKFLNLILIFRILIVLLISTLSSNLFCQDDIYSSKDLGKQFKHRFWYEPSPKTSVPVKPKIQAPNKSADNNKKYSFDNKKIKGEFYLKALINSGIPFFNGDKPPVLDGNYKAENLKLIYSNLQDDPIGTIFGNKQFQFSKNDLTNELEIKSLQENELSRGSIILFCGTTNSFSIFLDEDVESDQNKLKRLTLTSGILNDKGEIENLWDGFVIVEYDPESKIEDLLPIHSVRIFQGSMLKLAEDEDVNWEPSLPAETKESNEDEESDNINNKNENVIDENNDKDSEQDNQKSERKSKIKKKPKSNNE